MLVVGKGSALLTPGWEEENWQPALLCATSFYPIASGRKWALRTLLGLTDTRRQGKVEWLLASTCNILYYWFQVEVEGKFPKWTLSLCEGSPVITSPVRYHLLKSLCWWIGVEVQLTAGPHWNNPGKRIRVLPAFGEQEWGSMEDLVLTWYH